MVGHLRAVHAGYGAYELMGHGADRCKVVFHGEVHVARPDKSAFMLSFPLAVLHGSDRGVLRFERCPASCPEVAEHTSGIEQTLCLAIRSLIVAVIVKKPLGA